jgi:hypothetical protein
MGAICLSLSLRYCGTETFNFYPGSMKSFVNIRLADTIVAEQIIATPHKSPRYIFY